MPRKLVLCDCAGSQPIDAERIGQATGMACTRVHSLLCTRQASAAQELIAEGNVMIACGQEQARFEEIADEIGAESPAFVDLRDRAGWSAESAEVAPKMAALAAEAALEMPESKILEVVSEGVCLIVGASTDALPAARLLSDALNVTVLATDAPEPEPERGFDLVHGRLKRVRGALGGFEVTIDALAQIDPAGRGTLQMTPPQDGGQSMCDILIDLTGGTPLVQAPQKREGYLRADPRNPGEVTAVLLEAVQLVGTFEKPLYLRNDPLICAHSRAEQTGCTRCLDICPTGAITPSGDHVSIDPMVCAGCGACAAVCPSGAVSYEDPPLEALLRRMDTLARVYRQAGGTAPRLLVTDAGHGREMIALCARHGDGLPAAVIPFELSTIAGFGHAEMLAALAFGFAGVDVLLAPTTERDALVPQLALAEAISGPGRLRLLDIADPLELTAALAWDAVEPVVEPVLAMGSRRQVARLAAQTLHPDADAPLSLPEGAPYGAVLVDTNACTLCLSCVSLCPAGALLDNPDMPQLRFQEDACLQCGICRTICPEQAIELQPQLDLSDAALSQRVLNEEEPFACVECGALFGVKSTVEKVVEKLAGNHAMFSNPDAARMIQMCDNCRVQAQFHSEDNPFTGGERPRTRTTEDYYSERKDH